MQSNFQTPVLFIIFNSPNTTQRTFDEIKKRKPKYLYVAADGPRACKEGENEKCIRTREIIKQVDWDCELKTFFRSENSGGAGKGVSSAISWFFKHVEEGIILEYDCVPHPDFFEYCQELLEYYRNNDSVMFIGGSNFQDGIKRGDFSYYFSSLTHIWGWASWRYVWDKYIFDMKLIRREVFNNSLIYYNADKKIIRYWKWIFYLMRNNKIDTWDYQLMFTIWINRGLAIVPNTNLVSQLVLDTSEGGTYFMSHIEGVTNLPTYSIMPLSHPVVIEQNTEAYNYFCNKMNFKSVNIQILKYYLRLIIPGFGISLLKSFLKKPTNTFQ
jgi:hypothetical protein